MTPTRILLLGPPQSGKTKRLLAEYVKALSSEAFKWHVFLVPEVSQRQYLRALILQRHYANAIPEDGILTLPEFLHRLSVTTGLVSGRCLTTVEELAIIQSLISKQDSPIPLKIEAKVENARTLRAMLTTLRHAGLFLSWLLHRDISEEEESLNPLPKFLLRLARDYFKLLLRDEIYDGLFAQEKAVAAFEQDAKKLSQALPTTILVDGFYDAFYLHRRAILGLARDAKLFLMTLPDIPGDLASSRFVEWSMEHIPAQVERIDGHCFIHQKVLEELSEFKKKGEQLRQVPSLNDFELGSLSVRFFGTYIMEASFIADKILELHRRESISLDDFMVVVRAIDDPFLRVLQVEFDKRCIPLIVPVGGTSKGSLMSFLASALDFLALPSPSNTQNLISAMAFPFVNNKDALFRQLENVGPFVNPEWAKSILSRLGERSAVSILEFLTYARRLLESGLSSGNFLELMNKLVDAWWEAVSSQVSSEENGEARMLALAELERVKSILPFLRLSSREFQELSAMGVEAVLDFFATALEDISQASGERLSGGVYLVDVLTARQWQKEYVFIAQADAKHFPASTYQYLTAENLLPLRGLVDVPKARDLMEFEESLFLSAICRSKKRTYITLSQRDYDGREILPSLFVRLLSLLPSVRPLSAPEPICASSPRRAFTVAMKRVRFLPDENAKDENEIAQAVLASSEFNFLENLFRVAGAQDECASIVIPDASAKFSTLSATFLSDFRLCPYLALAKKLVGDELELPSVEDIVTEKELGTAVHRTLKMALEESLEPPEVKRRFAEVLRETARKKGILGIFDFELERLIYEWSGILVRFLSKERERMLLNGVEPLTLEWELEKEEEASEARRFRLVGFVDRVDKDGSNGIWVCDYKTSRLSSFLQNEAVRLRELIEISPLVYLYLVSENLTAADRASISPSFTYLLVRELRPSRQANFQVVQGYIWEEIRNLIHGTASSILSGNFPRSPHSIFECPRCEYFSVCRRELYLDLPKNFFEEQEKKISVGFARGGENEF